MVQVLEFQLLNICVKPKQPKALQGADRAGLGALRLAIGCRAEELLFLSANYLRLDGYPSAIPSIKAIVRWYPKKNPSGSAFRGLTKFNAGY